MVLDRIVARTLEDVARRRRETPLNTLRRGTRPTDRSLARALAAPRTGYVLECKRASPSEGVIRTAYDPGAIAAAYAPWADAVSVLTDEPFFQGRREHLAAVRDAVSVPVLAKDFVVDPFQVVEARANGADAVLLMLSILDDDLYLACADTAGEIGIETLTEVHEAGELRRALALDAPIIGINNRNLRTLTVDRDTVRQLAPRVPADRLLLSESGIRDHSDARTIAPLVDGFLVGTSLMRQTDLPRAVRQLVFGRTKVCGLTRREDAVAAWEAGATYGGLIFAEESPRRLTFDQAHEVRAGVPLTWVGVFVNADPTAIGHAAQALALGAVQLHGEESPDQVRALRAVLPKDCEVWKAVRVRDRVPTVTETAADRLLLDAWAPDARGGTGARFDWTLVGGHADRQRLIVGGGLTPETAAAADALDVFALDVNSGVEDAPGRKSAERLAAFFAALRGPGRSPPP